MYFIVSLSFCDGHIKLLLMIRGFNIGVHFVKEIIWLLRTSNLPDSFKCGC